MKRTFYLFCILILLSGCTFLKTPEIKGVVLDAETGNPIADARVCAEWRKMTAGPGGEGPGEVTKEVWLKANNQGQFIIPGHLVMRAEKGTVLFIDKNEEI